MTFSIDSRDNTIAATPVASSSRTAAAPDVTHVPPANRENPMSPTLWQRVTRPPELLTMIGNHLDAQTAGRLLEAGGFSHPQMATLVQSLPADEPRHLMSTKPDLSRIVRQTLTDTHLAVGDRETTRLSVQEAGPAAKNAAWVAANVPLGQAGNRSRSDYVNHALDWSRRVTNTQLEAGGTVARHARDTLEHLTLASRGPLTNRPLVRQEAQRYLDLAPRLDSGPLFYQRMSDIFHLPPDSPSSEDSDTESGADEPAMIGPKETAYQEVADLLDDKPVDTRALDGVVAGLGLALGERDVTDPALAQRLESHLAAQLPRYQPAGVDGAYLSHLRLLPLAVIPSIAPLLQQMVRDFETRLFDFFVGQLTRGAAANANEAEQMLDQIQTVQAHGLVDPEQMDAAGAAAIQSLSRPNLLPEHARSLQLLIGLAAGHPLP